MNRGAVVRACRLAGAALIVSAAAETIVTRWDRPAFSLVNFFSYFTVLSNLFAAGVLLAGALASGRRPSLRYELVRGAAVLYMTMTALVYAVALSHYDAVADATSPYTNWVMHRVMPLAVAVDWLVEPPRVPIAFRRALVWLAFPLAYLAYTLVRGPIVDWYPYPFLDPTRDGGYARVAGSATLVAVAFVALTWLTAAVGTRLGRRDAPAETPRAAAA